MNKYSLNRATWLRNRVMREQVAYDEYFKWAHRMLRTVT